MGSDFDPVDLVQLVSSAAKHASDLKFSIPEAEQSVEYSRVLDRLWREIDLDQWSAVFAYDVASPTGGDIGGHYAENGQLPETEFVAACARSYINQAGDRSL